MIVVIEYSLCGTTCVEWERMLGDVAMVTVSGSPPLESMLEPTSIQEFRDHRHRGSLTSFTGRK